MIKKAILPICLILAACGGGGESSPQGNGQSLSFTSISPSQINIVGTDAVPLFPQPFSVRYTGASTSPIVVVIEDPDAVFTSGYVSSYDNGIGTLVLTPATNRKVGTYQKDIKVHACTSIGSVNNAGNSPVVECRGEYAGSPLTIKRKVVIRELEPNKTSLNFTAKVGERPAEQVIQLPVDQLNPSAEWALWLSPNLANGTPDVQFGNPLIVGNQIKIQPYALAVGHYEATLIVGASGYLSKDIKLSYDVTAN